MTRRLLLALPLALLSACGTPQEQCIGAGTRDIRVLDRLIAESEGNLKRGYGYENVTISTPRWEQCGVIPGKDGKPPQPRLCLEDYSQTVRRPAAIDLDAEAKNLAAMKAKRAALVKAAQPLIKECKAKYPE